MKQVKKIINFKKDINLAVFGDIILDRYLKGDVERISPEAPVPIVNIKSSFDRLGGAANVMNNTINLGAKTWAFGVVGNDKNGKNVKKKMAEKKINVDNLITIPNRITSTKSRIISGNHQITRFDHETTDEIPTKIQQKMIDGISKIISKIDMILISDYEKGVLTKKLIKDLFKIAKKNKIPLLVDPKYKNYQYYKGFEFVKINSVNAEKLTDIPTIQKNYEKICKLLLKKLDCKNIIVSLGKNGLIVMNNGKIIHIKTAAKQIYDVTGAGDVMTATLGITLSRGYDLVTACKIGNLASAISISKVGTYSISLKELINSIKNEGEQF